MKIESGATRVVGEAFAEFAGGDDEAGPGEGGELRGDDVVGEGAGAGEDLDIAGAGQRREAAAEMGDLVDEGGGAVGGCANAASTAGETATGPGRRLTGGRGASVSATGARPWRRLGRVSVAWVNFSRVRNIGW
jgi:hypothetical protein